MITDVNHMKDTERQLDLSRYVRTYVSLCKNIYVTQKYILHISRFLEPYRYIAFIGFHPENDMHVEVKKSSKRLNNIPVLLY